MASFSSGRPPAGRVAVVLRVAAGVDGGLDDVVGRREVGLAGAEADDRLARRLQGLGLGVDGQRGRLGDGGDGRVREHGSESGATWWRAWRDAASTATGFGDASRCRRDRTPRESAIPDITIPADLLPADGRFGCGPSKVRPEAVDALAEAAPDYLGTSHRQATVQFMVERAAQRAGRAVRPARRLRGPARQRRHDRVLGRRHLRAHRPAQPAPELRRVLVEVRRGVAAAPHLATRRSSPRAPGTHPRRSPTPGVDAYGLTHNETSTGVAMPLRRPDGADADGLVLVDATSAAGGLRFDPSQVDVYYFAPQKCLASDGGLWLAAVLARRHRAHRAHRRVGPLDPGVARPGDRPRQLAARTRPTTRRRWPRSSSPSQQVEWINDNGGLELAASRVRPVGRDHLRLGRGVELRHAVRGRPGAAQPRGRPPSTSTTSIDATTVSAVLRANGIVDTETYRKLGRNQLRIALFPAIDPDDVAALTGASTTSSPPALTRAWRRLRV